MASLHGPTLFMHAPDQPEKTNPLFGSGLSVTAVPFSKLVKHVAPHWMPAGLLVTVPLPSVVTVSVANTAGGVGVLAAEPVVRNSRMIFHEG